MCGKVEFFFCVHKKKTTNAYALEKKNVTSLYCSCVSTVVSLFAALMGVKFTPRHLTLVTIASLIRVVFIIIVCILYGTDAGCSLVEFCYEQ
jgi:amino acid transporter